jgi:hypothetical protein
MEAELRQMKADLEKSAKPQEVIKFKDCVGRKFSFPFHQSKTWAVSSSFSIRFQNIRNR